MERARTIARCAIVSGTVAAVVIPETSSNGVSVGADERDVRAGDITVLEGGLEEGAAGAFVTATAGLEVARVEQVRRTC